jgi:triphosphoribosyl-dephospho-CoA synthetase
VVCPLCGTRRARRGCPALGQQICAVCCGTKRLVQIRCPSDCAWLASAREHPPAASVRQQQRDVGMVVQFMRDFSERQSQLFVLITTFLVRYETPDLPALLDDDVAEGMSALAATFDTASRGVIYDHRPASVLAGRLTTALKPMLAEAGLGAGSAFERDAAVVLRRIGEAVGDVRALDQANRTAFLDLLERVISKTPAAAEAAPDARPPESSRLIVP